MLSFSDWSKVVGLLGQKLDFGEELQGTLCFTEGVTGGAADLAPD